MINYWLVKSEPNEYSWDDFISKKRDCWDGVRNYTARNNLKNMKKGDFCFFYHSNKGKEIVGIAKVVKEHYQDPTTKDERWVVVDLVPEKKLARPISLREIKQHESLREMELVSQSRLSVSKVTENEFVTILALSDTK